MERCKTCKFWSVQSWQDKGWGICGQMMSDNGQPIRSGTLAVAYDYESYCANTHTNEGFSCIMHQVKE